MSSEINNSITLAKNNAFVSYPFLLCYFLFVHIQVGVLNTTRYNVVHNLQMNRPRSRRNISKVYFIAHIKTSVFRLTKAFPFDTGTNYVICVPRYRVIPV